MDLSDWKSNYLLALEDESKSAIYTQLLLDLMPTPFFLLSTVVLTYRAGTSEIMKIALEKFNIRVILEPNKSIGSSLFELKDTIPKHKVCNCVYSIKCAECDAEYIGQTSRDLNARISEYKRLTKKPPRNKIEYETLVRNSALVCHARDTGHKINFDDIKILRKNLGNKRERLVAEAI